MKGVLRFFGSICHETVQPSARIYSNSLFDLRMKMLGEMLGEMLDRLTRALRFTQGQVIFGTNFPIEDTCPRKFFLDASSFILHFSFIPVGRVWTWFVGNCGELETSVPERLSLVQFLTMIGQKGRFWRSHCSIECQWSL